MPGTPPPSAQLVTVSGIVQDSLAARVVSGASVQIGGKSATTDFLGAFQLADIDVGIRTLTVSATGFEPFSKTITLSTANTLQNIPLRRTRPFVKNFAISNNGGTLTATLMDLQGAATIDRNNSSVGYTVPGSTNVHLLGASTTTTVDAVSLRASVNTGKTGITQATWVIRDVSGNFARFLCIGAGSCTEETP